jgi:hypothetical protein
MFVGRRPISMTWGERRRVGGRRPGEKEFHMVSRRILIGAVAAVIGFCAPAAAQDSANEARLHRVTGEKLDSGLGRLPHDGGWKGGAKMAAPRVQERLNPVAGEKLDSGLGELSPNRSPEAASVVVGRLRD